MSTQAEAQEQQVRDMAEALESGERALVTGGTKDLPRRHWR
jgi:preprotein translocase subunit YajC